MLRLSKLTDYGTVLMTTLAQRSDQPYSASELAEISHIAAPTVSKLLKQLAQAGLVESQRGSKGGYRLARSANDIDMAEVIAALEGPIALTECAGQDSQCGIGHTCGVRGNWQVINFAIRNALEGVSLADMARPIASPALEARLEPMTQLSQSAI